MSEARETMKVLGELSKTLNTVYSDLLEMHRLSTEKYQDLTQNMVFWTRAQAWITGVSTVFSGAAGIAGNFADKMQPFSAELVRNVCKTASQALPQLGEAGRLLAQGPATKSEGARRMTELNIQAIQKARDDMSSQIQQMLQTVSSIQQMERVH